jgi:hypothetical protein
MNNIVIQSLNPEKKNYRKKNTQNVCVKGQIKSEWIYEIINFPKPKNLKDFCPMYYKNSQGRNPSNFLVHFLEIDDFMNSFGLNLTFIVSTKPEFNLFLFALF